MQTIRIDKAIVSFQTPEFLKVKQYRYFYIKKIELSKQLYRFKPQIFEDETIQVLLHTKNWIDEAIVLLQTTESFSNEVIQFLLLLLPGEMRRFRFNQALKGQHHENLSSFSLKIWAPHKVDQLEKTNKKFHATVPLSLIKPLYV